MQGNLTADLGHNRGPGPTATPPWLMGRRVVISPRPRARGGPRWVLRIMRERAPFSGWVGRDDPLATDMELTFASKEAAIGYAQRFGLEYRVVAGPPRRAQKPEQAEAGASSATILHLGAVYGRCELPGLPDLDRALVAPASVFAEPEEVLRHPLLTYDCKREVLLRWAHDEYLKELAETEGMSGGEPSRLDEVKAALIALGEPRRPSPAAPAMFVLARPGGAVDLDTVATRPSLALAA